MPNLPFCVVNVKVIILIPSLVCATQAYAKFHLCSSPVTFCWTLAANELPCNIWLCISNAFRPANSAYQHVGSALKPVENPHRMLSQGTATFTLWYFNEGQRLLKMSAPSAGDRPQSVSIARKLLIFYWYFPMVILAMYLTIHQTSFPLYNNLFNPFCHIDVEASHLWHSPCDILLFQHSLYRDSVGSGRMKADIRECLVPLLEVQAPLYIV